MKRFLTLAVLAGAVFWITALPAFSASITDIDASIRPGIGSQAGDPLTLAQCFKWGNCSVEHIFLLANNLIRWMVGVAGALALFMYVVGGIWMIFSAGSSSRIERGKDILVGTTIALFFMLASWLIVNFVLLGLGSTDYQLAGDQCTTNGDCTGGLVCSEKQCVEPCYTKKQLQEPTKLWACNAPSACGIASVADCANKSNCAVTLCSNPQQVCCYPPT